MATMPLRSILLNGTWNFVNETKGSMGNMSMDYMNNMTGTSGKITFYWDQFQITVNGKPWPGHTSNPGWSIDGNTLALSGLTPAIHPEIGPAYFTSIVLTFTDISPNHIELTDSHCDTIHMRKLNGQSKTQVST